MVAEFFQFFYRDTSDPAHTPPPAPETVVKGYNANGYWDLINSLAPDERKQILAELETPQIIARAQRLKSQLAQNEVTYQELNTTREMFLAALLLLQRNEISKNQLASLHLVDSAIRTLYTDPYGYLTYIFAENGYIQHSISAFPATAMKDLPEKVVKSRFNEIPLPNYNYTISELPSRMQQPLVKRFFNFSDDEWITFTNEMILAPESEQFIHVLVSPEFGCWSSIIFRIQDVLECMHILDWYKQAMVGVLIEKIMVVPSFTMFQAAMNAKAKALNRTTLEFVPTYNYLDDNTYCREKSIGRIPLTLYLPERQLRYQYNSTEGKFRTNIDGHPNETAFAGAIHDTYHGLRELQMTPDIATARVRLASLAKYHPDNIFDSNGRSISTILMDGELVFSYPLHTNTIFKHEPRCQQVKFGGLFYVESLRGVLSNDLKRTFIRDMVEHSDEWLESFNIGRDDLLHYDQVIYNAIKKELMAENKRVTLT